MLFVNLFNVCLIFHKGRVSQSGAPRVHTVCRNIFQQRTLIDTFWQPESAQTVATKLFVSQSVKNNNKCFAW